MPLLPGAAPYAADGGHTVSAPRLPGHGTRWQDPNATTWHQWVTEADRNLDWLARRSDTVMVMGVSNGATIGLRLAETPGDAVAGVLAVNPVVQSEPATPDHDAPLIFQTSLAFARSVAP